MSAQNLTNEVLGEYQLRQQIGQGGMGTVYRAYQAKLKREVAVKVLQPHLAQQADYALRFNREAETAAKLEHPHIVPIYDYGTQYGVSYIAMRLLTGGTLAERISQSVSENRTLISLGEISIFLNQLASALDYAHSKNVIHRDIKTSNIMFDDQGSAYLMDFGIARLMEGTTGLTGSGMSMGSPSYMAPEQWRGEAPTSAVDQYALGVVIYSLLSGRLPFEANTPYALMNKHINDQPTPVNVFRPDVPDAVAHVLNQAISKTPSDRFPTVTDFAKAFDEAIDGQRGEPVGFFKFKVRHTYKAQVTPSNSSSSRESPNGPSTNRRRWIAVGGAAAILIALGVVLLSLLQDNSTDLSVRQTIVALNITETAVAGVRISLTPTRGIISILSTSLFDTTEESAEEASASQATRTATGIPMIEHSPTAAQTSQPTTPAPTLTETNNPQPTPTETAIPSKTPDWTTPAAAATQTADAAVRLLAATRAQIEAQATRTAQAQIEAQATRTAQAQIEAQAIRTAQAQIEAQATHPPPAYPEAQATHTAQAQIEAQATRTAQAQIEAQATRTAQELATLAAATLPTACQKADFNENSQIDIFDIRLVAVALGTTLNEPEFQPRFDLDNDGDVDVFDMSYVSRQYGESCD